MVFDILVEEASSTPMVPDSGVRMEKVAEGIKSGNITSVHSCVEYVNANTEEGYVVSGNDIGAMFTAAVKEARQMSLKADNMAASGATVVEMAAAISGVYFTFDDIKELKIEEYGSTTAWKAAMVASAEETI
jgi:hypothetical protein